MLYDCYKIINSIIMYVIRPILVYLVLRICFMNVYVSVFPECDVLYLDLYHILLIRICGMHLFMLFAFPSIGISKMTNCGCGDLPWHRMCGAFLLCPYIPSWCGD
jgi:hypothetical protein